MLPFTIKPNSHQFQNTLGQQKHETSIMQRNQPPNNSINFDQIVKLPPLGYDKRASKQRYGSVRQSLPVGNFDWADYNKPNDQSNKQIPQWSCRKKIIVIVLALVITTTIICLVVYLLQKKQNSLHVSSVEPILPSFYEISGIMNASKVEPLVESNKNQKILHLRIN